MSGAQTLHPLVREACERLDAEAEKRIGPPGRDEEGPSWVILKSAAILVRGEAETAEDVAGVLDDIGKCVAKIETSVRVDDALAPEEPTLEQDANECLLRAQQAVIDMVLESEDDNGEASHVRELAVEAFRAIRDAKACICNMAVVMP